MKIEIEGIEEQKKFQPFILKLLIEDESDLEDLAVRFNARSDLLNNSNVAAYRGYEAKDSYEVWKSVDALLKDKPYMK